MKKYLFVALVIVAAPLVLGCQPDGAITILNSQTIGGPTGVAPTATPAPTAGARSVATVSVGFFGRSCPGGVPAAPNDLRVGCTGRITATPKSAGGQKLDPQEHGSTIRWFYSYGSAALHTSPDSDNEFNRDATAVAPGLYKLCAEVRSVVGCVEGAVIP